MTRTKAYKWLAEQLQLSEERAHIGSFEMDQCQTVIDLCKNLNRRKPRNV
ncbi:MAG: zinc-finger-containing protein [Oscillospiraceae bacterium]